jgi:hypothetical protein
MLLCALGEFDRYQLKCCEIGDKTHEYAHLYLP